MSEENNIIIYNAPDGKASVSLLAKEDKVWLNQNQLAELFDTSVPNISMRITNILKVNELGADSVVKNYLTTAADGKKYDVTFYSLDRTLPKEFMYNADFKPLEFDAFRKQAKLNTKDFDQ